MSSLEDRMKAVSLYFKYGCSPAAVRQELSYPTKNTVKQWAREFKAIGTLHERSHRRRHGSKHSEEQKQAAVDYYLQHARNLRRTIAVLGYPNRETLRQWLDEALPDRRGLHSKRRLEPNVEFTPEQKQAAVLDLVTREGTAQEVAEKYGVTRAALYKWKSDLLGKERPVGKRRKPNLSEDRDALLSRMESLKEQVETLEKQVYRLRLEKDGLEVTAELLKKGQGADPKKLTNREKATAVGTLRKMYDFHADVPNAKWLTDLTESPLPAGKIYLSPVIDCFDGMAVSWSIGTSPDAGMANSMLDNAISTLGEDEHPVVHSDRGSHYRWPGWIERMEAAGLTRSMSKKGCSPDNAACEGFFGRVKNEVFYGRSWAGVSIEEFMCRLDGCLHRYNEGRIKTSLRGKSPMEYRQASGYA